MSDPYQLWCSKLLNAILILYKSSKNDDMINMIREPYATKMTTTKDYQLTLSTTKDYQLTLSTTKHYQLTLSTTKNTTSLRYQQQKTLPAYVINNKKHYQHTLTTTVADYRCVFLSRFNAILNRKIYKKWKTGGGGGQMMTLWTQA